MESRKKKKRKETSYIPHLNWLIGTKGSRGTGIKSLCGPQPVRRRARHRRRPNRETARKSVIRSSKDSHIRECIYIWRRTFDLNQPVVEVRSNRVLRARSFVHDPGLREAVLSARPILWTRLQDVTEEVLTSDTDASVSNRLGRGGCAVSVPPYFAAGVEQGAAGHHPIQDTSKGPDVYPISLRVGGVLHFGRHVALRASAGLQVGRGVGEGDAL